MPHRRKIAGIVLLIAALVAASMSVWFWSQPVTVPTVMTVPSTSSPSPQEEPLPSVMTPPTPVPTTATKELKNPRGNPISLTIKRGAKTFVKTMPFAPRVIDPEHPKWFSSRCGAIAYWSKPTWPKPGVENLKKSLITGHVMCGVNNWYPLQHLQPKKVKGKEIPGGHKGDLLYIQYSSGDLVIARARENSRDVPKSDLNKMKSYTENGGKKAREIRLTTCDREGIIRKDGHALNNVVQRFIVIDVIRAN